MATSMAKEHVGVVASPGIVVGKAFVYKQKDITISQGTIQSAEVDAERELFFSSRTRAEAELAEIQEKALKNLGEEEAEIFEGHREIILDEDLEEEILTLIEKELYPADRAVEQVFEENAKEMESLDNPYMQERAADIRDIGRRLLYAIKGVELTSLESLSEPVIVIAPDLTPSDTAQMDRSRVLGFATEQGGTTSHVAIMAKCMELPALVGMGEFTDTLASGDTIILDASPGGNPGKLIIHPSEPCLEEYNRRIEQFKKEQEELYKLKDLPGETTDGHRVDLCANICISQDMEGACNYGADGVGLYRTEFLFMDRKELPSEEEQFLAYKGVAEAMHGKGVIIRTLDIGGDKEIAYLDFPKEENPFLGWRGIRMCLDKPEILTTQLRAILRASVYGKLRIMYPMIIGLEEVRQLNRVLDGVKEELLAEQIPFDTEIEVGVMIETPAAAAIADALIEEVDFFSIGTNDLTQYTLAVDRGNKKIAHLYQPFHPAVLRLIKGVIDASHRAGKWTGMCGELAGDERATRFLVGMGLDEFSMSAASIGRIKAIIRESNMADLQDFAATILAKGSVSDILQEIELANS